VEYSKDTLYGQDAARRAEVLKVMHYVFANSLKLLHPFMPFLTEELWHEMGYGGADDFIMTSRWPAAVDAVTLQKWGAMPDCVEFVDQKHELIREGRMLRSDYDISPAQKIDYLVKPHSAEAAKLLLADREALGSLLRAANLTIDPALVPGKAMPSGMTRLADIFMPLEGLIDVAAERQRLAAQMEKLAGEVQRINAKLDNANFVNKAPAEVVAQQRAKREQILADAEKMKRLISGLPEV
jgi:valyl-tRNA synthetase